MLDPDFLSAIGHPVRLRALVLFEREPGSTSDLSALTGLSTSAVSYHVGRLANAGLIEEAGKGRGGQRLWRARAAGWAELQALLAASASGATASEDR